MDGCKESDCILLGGETAEMPGFYPEGEYDLAGFAVGSVKKEKVIDGSRIKAGDVVLGIASSGVHSNGFSLVRKVLEISGKTMHDIAPWSGESFGLTLLTPTVLYVKTALKLIDTVDVRVSLGGVYFKMIFCSPTCFNNNTNLILPDLILISNNLPFYTC